MQQNDSLAAGHPRTLAPELIKLCFSAVRRRAVYAASTD